MTLATHAGALDREDSYSTGMAAPFLQAIELDGDADHRPVVRRERHLLAVAEVQLVPVDDRAAPEEVPDAGQVGEREVLVADLAHG